MNVLENADLCKPEVGDPQWDLVLRVAASPGFEKSERLSAFLLYVCERAIQHRPNEITEQQIGVHVYGRPWGYNAADDNIVRSQARVLRWKLDQYFAQEGRSEPVVITIPKGAYLPVFETRTVVNPPVAEPIAAPARARTLSPLLLVMSGMIVLLSIACAWLAFARVAGKSLPTTFGALWQAFLGENQRTIIVQPDQVFALLQRASSKRIALSEYLADDFPEHAKKLSTETGFEALVPGFYRGELTSALSAVDVSLISRLPRAASSSIDVRGAPAVNMADLRTGSAIFIGTVQNNPWIQLFDNSLNFGFDVVRHNYCINRHPKAGELAEYDSSSREGLRTAYSGLAYLPSLNHHGDVLLILGTGPANKMAAEFISNEKFCGPFLNRVRAEAGRGRLPYFEVLLKTTGFRTEPATAQVEAYRILPY
jgi:hypothetical protein